MDKMSYADIRKKANTYFFVKVTVNILLMIVGALLISLFLRQMQRQTALVKQQQNSEMSLHEAVSILEKNSQDAEELSYVFHDGNQDMLDDLNELLTSGLFNSLLTETSETRSEVFAEVVERSGVDYLFLMSEEGRILLSPNPEFYNVDVVEYGMLTQENLELLKRGTKDADGSLHPAQEHNSFGDFYFYSHRFRYGQSEMLLVLGANASTLDVQISSLKDVSVVLSRATVNNRGFLFAVDAVSNTFLYYQNGEEVLTGQNALDAGLSRLALQDGYSGIQTINGTRYYCVSKTFGESTVICAVADTSEIFANDRYVLFWSISGFLIVMVLCLAYAVIIRNDFVRNVVETKKKIFQIRGDHKLIFDISIFNKVFPLMVAGVLVLFGISFYTQTLLEISQNIELSKAALAEVSSRYEESVVNRDIIQNYYDGRFLAKTKLLAYLLEEDPAVLNEETDRQYSEYDLDGSRYYLTDDEGNKLRSVSGSARLQELCRANDLKEVYIFDENGRTIATSSANWFFTISHQAGDQSYAFLNVLDGRVDSLVQQSMMSDTGEESQFIGVAFTYYTTVNRAGETVYVSHYEYETFDERAARADRYEPPLAPISAHRGLVQIELRPDLTAKLLASTELEYIFSSDMLSDGFIVLFDGGESHWCLYSPNPASIDRTAEELGVTPNAFSGSDYYGFVRVNGIPYFQFFRYADGYYIATAIPRSSMYQARTTIALLTAITSLVLILILSATVTLTTDEEEALYATMSDSQEKKGLDSAIFHIILPSGKRVSTVKAAARWDNRYIPWSERSPEQKLAVLISGALGLLMIYIAIAFIGAKNFFGEESIVQYMISGTWERSPNIFALSVCVVELILTSIVIALFRIPVRLLSSLLGARSETVGHLLLSVVKYGGTIAVLFHCLYLVGVDSTSLLASASILSLVVGLGAQSLIKDILAGIFIVFEGEFRVGDIVTIGDYRGTVMDIGLRTTKVLGLGGNIKVYNNSDITGVLNMTKEASIAKTTISIEYGQDLNYVEAVLRRELPHLREKNPKISDGPTYLGVSKLGESGVDLLIICKCAEQDIFDINRYLNREVLMIFYNNHINVPFPNVTVSQLDMSDRRTYADFLRDEQRKQNGGDITV